MLNMTHIQGMGCGICSIQTSQETFNVLDMMHIQGITLHIQGITPRIQGITPHIQGIAQTLSTKRI
jgi:hypothetical protein